MKVTYAVAVAPSERVLRRDSDVYVDCVPFSAVGSLKHESRRRKREAIAIPIPRADRDQWTYGIGTDVMLELCPSIDAYGLKRCGSYTVGGSHGALNVS